MNIWEQQPHTSNVNVMSKVEVFEEIKKVTLGFAFM